MANNRRTECMKCEAQAEAGLGSNGVFHLIEEKLQSCRNPGEKGQHPVVIPGLSTRRTNRRRNR